MVSYANQIGAKGEPLEVTIEKRWELAASPRLRNRDVILVVGFDQSRPAAKKSFQN
jgi:hypothetical protein